MSEGRSEHQTPPTVSFQGVAGAYSEEAIRQFFGPQAGARACLSFADIFDAVNAGEVDYGLLPVENAVAGAVNGAYSLLFDRDLYVWAEVVLRVRHMLLALPGTRPEDITQVRSHPQALAQCRNYLAAHGLEPVPAFDTAGSARDLAAAPEPHTAVIAGRLAAELYGLHVIEENIEDMPFNLTRFLVVSRQEAPRADPSKTSLVFATRHEPGALVACLAEFSQRGINLTRIESQPRLNQPWHYVFFVDFSGHWQDPECQAALLGLLHRSSFVKLLGSYPAAQP